MWHIIILYCEFLFYMYVYHYVDLECSHIPVVVEEEETLYPHAATRTLCCSANYIIPPANE